MSHNLVSNALLLVISISLPSGMPGSTVASAPAAVSGNQSAPSYQ